MNGNKDKVLQRKYFTTLHEIFTELDLTEFDQDGDNCIDLGELKDYFKKIDFSVPDYLAENIFYSIDTDRNGKIIPIEYLKWKMNVTVDDMIAWSEVVSTNKQMDNDNKSDDTDSDDMNISLDDDGLFGILDEMEREEEKMETEKLLKNMEIENEKKRVEHEKYLKQKLIEDVRRRKYAEEQKKKQQEIIALKLKLLEKEQDKLTDLENEEDDKKKEKDLEDMEPEQSDNEEHSSDDLEFDEDTDSDWSTSDSSADYNAQTIVLEEENMCVSLFPCLKMCGCCNKPRIIRRKTANPDDKEKDITKLISSSKRRLSKFIYKYGDQYVDDETMVLPQDRLSRLTKDVNMEDKMGIYFWSLVLDKQSQKAYDCLWPVLRYLASELPTPIAVELVELYRVELSRYPPIKIEGIVRVIVESSKFTIATALVFAAFFNERAERDLANTRLLAKYSEDYQNLAAEELRQIESDYLASIAMMSKSFHDSKNPFEIAVDNELIDFLSSDRMARISHAMWVKRDLLKPEISENSFEVRSTGLMAIVKALPNPRDFYFTPIGFNFTETFLFALYLGIFTIITIRGRRVYDDLLWADWLLFVCNFGYIFNELLQFLVEGPNKYFQTWENAVDITVSIIWIIIMFLRILSVILIESIPQLSQVELLSGLESEDSFLNLLFTALWVINIILLWIRCLHFLMLSNQEGPLINVTKSMGTDVKNWLYVFGVITIGFVFSLYFLVGDTNPYLETEQRAISLTLLAAFGQPNWVHVQSGEVAELNAITSWLVVIYSIVGFVLLVNLLIATMAESYSKTEGKSAKEVLLNTTTLAFELDTAPKVMPPPLNSILFVLFIIYNFIDILVLAFTAQFMNEQGFSKYWRCRNNDCKFLNKYSIIKKHIKQGWDKDFPCGLCDHMHTMDDITKKSKRRLRRKARGLEGAKSNFCSRLGHGFKELFQSKTKWKKHSWSCGYCRSRIPANYSADLERYFVRLRKTHNLDQHDVNFLKSMNPQLCPYCYRPRRPRARPTYILENISFFIFLVIVYPMIWFCLWPIYLYDSIKNPDTEKKDYKEFRERHVRQIGLRPDAATVRKYMPKSFQHQTLISLHHPIWRSLHKHRATVKGESLAATIHSANLRQERVKDIAQKEKRAKVAKISHLVMDVVQSMAKSRIKWQPTGSELMQRMSAISGVSIDTNWYEQHNTLRKERAQKDKALLMWEAGLSQHSFADRRNSGSKKHIRGGTTNGTGTNFDLLDLDSDPPRKKS